MTPTFKPVGVSYCTQHHGICDEGDRCDFAPGPGWLVGEGPSLDEVQCDLRDLGYLRQPKETL